MVNNHQVQLMRRPDRALGCGPAPANTKGFQQKIQNRVLGMTMMNCNHVLLCVTLQSQSASCVPQTVEEAELVLLTEGLIPLARAQSACVQIQ